MRTRSWATSLITTSVLAFVAAPAHAGTITRVDPPPSPEDIEPPTPYYEFTAAPGERNDVSVERLPNGDLRFSDVGAPLVGCVPEAPGTAVCQGDYVLSVALGDGDDQALTRGKGISVDGGPGADQLTGTNLDGGAGDDVLVGNTPANSLDGGPGRDRITGGADTDLISLGDGEPDVADGGGGEDYAMYTHAPTGIRVDLARGTADDGDVLANIEHAHGSAHDDRLRGDDGDNQLQGNAGEDRLEGLGGADRLRDERGDDVLLGGAGADSFIGNGADVVVGGPGDDVISLAFGGTPDVRCGPGRDDVDTVAHTGVPRLRDCERVLGDGPTVRLTRAGLTLTGWDTALGRTPCRIRATVGTVSSTLRRWRGARVPLTRPATVRLRPSGRCDGALGRGYRTTAFRVLR